MQGENDLKDGGVGRQVPAQLITQILQKMQRAHLMRLTPVVSIWSQMRSTHMGACHRPRHMLRFSQMRDQLRVRHLIVVGPEHAHAFSVHPQGNGNLKTSHTPHETCDSSHVPSHTRRISRVLTSCARVDSLNSTTTGTPMHVASVTTPGPAKMKKSQAGVTSDATCAYPVCTQRHQPTA